MSHIIDTLQINQTLSTTETGRNISAIVVELPEPMSVPDLISKSVCLWQEATARLGTACHHCVLKDALTQINKERKTAIHGEGRAVSQPTFMFELIGLHIAMYGAFPMSTNSETSAFLDLDAFEDIMPDEEKARLQVHQAEEDDQPLPRVH